ncbi:MAG: HVA1 family protein [Polyangiaceae bacterium]
MIARRTLYTIGHSTRPVEVLIDVLRAADVTCLVDIRRIPRSRTNPQFNLEVLPATLGEAGIAYVHSAALGGRRSKSKRVDDDANAGWDKAAFRNYADYAATPPFREGLRELLARAARETCAIMCAEAVWWRCHRRIVTDYALARGIPVVHLFTADESEEASLTPFAVVGTEGRVSYPPPAHANTQPETHGAPLARSIVANAPVRTMTLTGRRTMKTELKVGDRVSWNSEAGRVTGIIKKKLVSPARIKGYTVHASKEAPQYLIESEKTDHVAVHKGSALRKLKARAPRAVSGRRPRPKSARQ